MLAGIRVHDEVVRCPERVKCLEVGDWLEAECRGTASGFLDVALMTGWGTDRE